MEEIKYNKIYSKHSEIVLEMPQIVVVFPYLNNRVITYPITSSRIDRIEEEIRKLKRQK